uniref:Uncharacterized protein n=1 Tax=Anguilla anguilla TaxID=7936 RepID=A0A0E9R726_ANGAN
MTLLCEAPLFSVISSCVYDREMSRSAIEYADILQARI